MRTRTLAIAALIAGLALLPSALAEEPEEGIFEEPLVGAAAHALPDSLEAMLARALESNPDLALVEAKLAAARAHVSQTRLRVAQQVTMLHVERTRLTKLRDIVARRLVETQRRIEAGVVSITELTEATLAVAEADADLARTEAELRYVLGLGLPAK